MAAVIAVLAEGPMLKTEIPGNLVSHLEGAVWSEALPALSAVTITHRAGPGDSALGMGWPVPFLTSTPSAGGPGRDLHALLHPLSLLSLFRGSDSSSSPAWGSRLLRENTFEKWGLQALVAHSSGLLQPQ